MKARASSCKRKPVDNLIVLRRKNKGKGKNGGKRSPEKSEKSGVQDEAARGAVGRSSNFAAQPESR